MTSEHALSYVRELEASNSKNSHSNEFATHPILGKCHGLSKNLSSNNKELAEIMLNCLSLNPYYRLTAYDCLKNCKVFDSVRSEKKENIVDFLAHAVGPTKQPGAK